jgi:DNA-binding transcriptional LysR family regulator
VAALEGPDLEVRSLDPAVHLPVALVWRRERSAPPAARAFIELVRRETAVARADAPL